MQATIADSTSNDSMGPDFEHVLRSYEQMLNEGIAADIDVVAADYRDHPGFQSLALELAKIRIESDVRRGLGGDGLVSLGVLCRLPSLQTADAWEALVHEFTVRWITEQPLSMNQLAGQAGFAGESMFMRRLRCAIGELVPVEVAVRCGRQAPFCIRMRRDVVLGRQRRNEPPPYLKLQLDHCDRLIVSPNDARYIGRNQVAIEFESFDQLRITNSGSKLTITVNDSEELKPQESVVVQGSSKIEFESYAIRCDFR